MSQPGCRTFRLLDPDGYQPRLAAVGDAAFALPRPRNIRQPAANFYHLGDAFLVDAWMKTFLEQRSGAEFQCTRAQLLRFDGVPFREEYWIVKVLSRVACVGPQMVIDERAVPAGLNIFASEQLPGTLLIEQQFVQDLAHACRGNGFWALKLDEDLQQQRARLFLDER